MEVVGKGRSDRSLKGKIRDEEIEERRRENRALRNARVDNHRGRFPRLKETRSRSPTKVGSKPPNNVGVDIRFRELLEEKSVVNRIKGFRNVERYHSCAGRRFAFIKAIGS